MTRRRKWSLCETMSKPGKAIITGAEQALAYLKGDKTKGRAYKVRARGINVKVIRENAVKKALHSVV